MRGEASRIADRVSRDSLAPRLRDSGEDAWRIGNELFTITNALDHNIQLERALTDPSRPVEDKVAVVKTLIGDEAHPLTMESCPIWWPAVGAACPTSPTPPRISVWMA